MGGMLENETPAGVLARLQWALRNAGLRFLLFWYHKGAAAYVMAVYHRKEAARGGRGKAGKRGGRPARKREAAGSGG